MRRNRYAVTPELPSVLGTEVAGVIQEVGEVVTQIGRGARVGKAVLVNAAAGGVGSLLEALAPKGRLVIYGALNIQSFQLGVPELLGLIFRNQSVTSFAVAPLLTAELLRQGLTELFDLTVSGRLRVIVGGTYPLERAAEAHRALEGRRTTGKLVLAA